MGCVVNTTIQLFYKAGWVPGLVLTCAENLASTRLGPLDRPALRELLYWQYRIIMQSAGFEPLVIGLWFATSTRWQFYWTVKEIICGD